MPRKIRVAFIVLGSLALLMCGVLVYLGKGKWVTLIVGFHALIAVLWYSIRAVRPHEADIPAAATPSQSDREGTDPVNKDWTSEPPPLQERLSDSDEQNRYTDGV